MSKNALRVGVGGPVGCGKTALALNIVQNVALRAHKRVGGDPRSVAFFSLEMSKEQLVNRMLCAEANIDSQRLRIGEMKEDDWTHLWDACDVMSKAKIYIDDNAGITVTDMRSQRGAQRASKHGGSHQGATPLRQRQHHRFRDNSQEDSNAVGAFLHRNGQRYWIH